MPVPKKPRTKPPPREVGGPRTKPRPKRTGVVVPNPIYYEPDPPVGPPPPISVVTPRQLRKGKWYTPAEAAVARKTRKIRSRRRKTIPKKP